MGGFIKQKFTAIMKKAPKRKNPSCTNNYIIKLNKFRTKHYMEGVLSLLTFNINVQLIYEHLQQLISSIPFWYKFKSINFPHVIPYHKSSRAVVHYTQSIKSTSPSGYSKFPYMNVLS